jgi:hypothetical protein
LKRVVVFVHRWMGVLLSLIFLMWFASGVVMMYFDFPAVRPADRLEHAEKLDSESIRIGPAQAASLAGSSGALEEIRLTMFDGRPLYILGQGRAAKRVYADSGERWAAITVDQAERIAARWSGEPSTNVRRSEVDAPDQWTIQDPLRRERPLWKFSWPDGIEIYVAGLSGDVVQYTTRASRFWAYLGAIPHWMYFTPLRVHQLAWSRTVIWISGAGTAVTILGLAIGVWMYRFRETPQIPYRGQKRWHMLFGLTFGATAATWAFSGMLSMDPFPAATPRITQEENVVDALRDSLDPAAFREKSPSGVLTELKSAQVKELDLISIDNEPYYLAWIGRSDARMVPAQPAVATISTKRIVELVSNAIAPTKIADARELNRYDAYYLDRHRLLPLPVVVIQLEDRDRTRFYIDPKTVRVVRAYSSQSWMTRWLYHAPHSFDFPWLYEHRPFWDIVVLTLLCGGVTLSITSILLSWRVLRRKLSHPVHARF